MSDEWDGQEIPDDLVEIRDPQIDPAGIMQEIRRRVAQRRKEAGYQAIRFPTYGDLGFPEEPSDVPYNIELYQSLRSANQHFAAFETAVDLAPSPATRLPLVGAIWARIRREVHNLVLFYVNRAVRQQMTVNRSLVQVVNHLTKTAQNQQRELETLRQRVATLTAEAPSESSVPDARTEET